MSRNISLYLRFETKDSQPQRGNFWQQPDPTPCIDREDSPAELHIRAKDPLHPTWGMRNNWPTWKPYSQDTRESVSHSRVRFLQSLCQTYNRWPELHCGKVKQLRDRWIRGSYSKPLRKDSWVFNSTSNRFEPAKFVTRLPYHIVRRIGRRGEHAIKAIDYHSRSHSYSQSANVLS